MSSKGVYSALSGAMAQSLRLDSIANNLANSSTPGFKADRQTFKEYLTTLEKLPEVNTVPKNLASVKSFYDMQGTDKSFAVADGTFTDFSQGGIKPTGNLMDIALDGKGMIEILTPQGVRFTRHGALSVNQEGFLVTKEGQFLLSPGEGVPPENRKIQIGQGGPLTIARQGEIYRDGNNLGKLSVVEFPDPDQLRKMGNGTFAPVDSSVARVLNSNTEVMQGFMETSNVNVIREMTEMLEATRSFESNQKAIKAFDEMDAKLVNDVPKL